MLILFTRKNACLSAVVAAAVLFGCGQSQGLSRVVKVYDGDTIGLANGEKVRLIGIDCPESYESDKLQRDSRRSGEPIAKILAKGRQAGGFTRGLVLGKDVLLEFDEERRDKYGRLLAYVWVKEDSHAPAEKDSSGFFVTENKAGYPETFIFLNATIMNAGFAQPMSIPPNTLHARTLRRYYDAAREARRGLHH